MPALDEWVRVCYHEAGHAVVSLSLGYPARPTVLRCVLTGGQLRPEGTYQLTTGLIQDGVWVPPHQLVIRLAAGGVAEELRFGNHGVGVTGDHAKINSIVGFTGDHAAAQERDGHFPQTRSLLQANWESVVRVSEIGLRRFRAMNLMNAEFENTTIISANSVSRLFGQPNLTADERVDARHRAFMYAIERGNGSLPEYVTELANNDFLMAAGDLLGSLL